MILLHGEVGYFSVDNTFFKKEIKLTGIDNNKLLWHDRTDLYSLSVNIDTIIRQFIQI